MGVEVTDRLSANFLGVGKIQSSHRLVPKQSFVADAFALPDAVYSNAQINGFVDQHTLEGKLQQAGAFRTHSSPAKISLFDRQHDRFQHIHVRRECGHEDGHLSDLFHFHLGFNGILRDA